MGQDQDKQNTPPAGLYIPPSWQGLKQQCVHLAQFGGGIQVIHGEPGAGKTTFFQLLREELASPDFIAITALERFRAEEFLIELSWQLGLRPENSASFGELLAGLRSYVQSLQSESARAIVAIDDAHHIPDAPLAALVSVLQGRSEPGLGLHFMLFGLPGLAQRLDAMQLLDIEVHDHSLPSLSASETEQFLYAQGIGLASPLSADAISRIWSRSDGVPGRILSCLDENLKAAKATPAEKPAANTNSRSDVAPEPIWKSLPLAHVAALLVLTLFLVWAFFIRTDPETESDIDKDVERIVIPAPLNTARSESSAPQMNLSKSASANESFVASQSQATTEVSPSENEQPENISDAQVSEQNNVSSVSVSSSDPVKNSETTPVVAPSSVIEPVSEKKNVSSSIALSSSSSSSSPYSESERTLINYSPNAYVLQIMASSDKENLRQFVGKQRNSQNLLIYRANKAGKTLYILVEGYYADKQSAEAAVANLPAEQRRGGPWPKQLKRVQQEIKDAVR